MKEFNKETVSVLSVLIGNRRLDRYDFEKGKSATFIGTILQLIFIIIVLFYSRYASNKRKIFLQTTTKVIIIL